MKTVSIHEAKTHLSRLLEGVAKGEPFIIAKAGKPIAKVEAIESPGSGKAKRLGFLEGCIKVPADFDRMGDKGIEKLFGSGNS